MQHPIAGAPSSWLTYVNVDDVKASTAKAKSLGAEVMRDVTEVPGMGWFSIIAAPVMAAAMRRASRNDLARLKALLERT
jgi:hypothetical protein